MSTLFVFDETGKEREVKRVCKVCIPEAEGQLTAMFDPIHLVSPNGTVHHGADYGMTACGCDATGPKWWWRI